MRGTVLVSSLCRLKTKTDAQRSEGGVQGQCFAKRPLVPTGPGHPSQDSGLAPVSTRLPPTVLSRL